MLNPIARIRTERFYPYRTMDKLGLRVKVLVRSKSSVVANLNNRLLQVLLKILTGH